MGVDQSRCREGRELRSRSVTTRCALRRTIMKACLVGILVAAAMAAAGAARSVQDRERGAAESRVQAHLDAAKAAAGSDFAAVYSRICREAVPPQPATSRPRSEEHTSELQSLRHLVCRL